jgi:predicted DNA binding CopG/RHH family protein
MERPASPSRLFARSAEAPRQQMAAAISVRLPEDLLERLAEVGNAEGLTMSDAIRVVLERGLSAPKPPRGKSK